jgi:N-acetylglutamate synthase-like GNAT family acetyltransferase
VTDDDVRAIAGVIRESFRDVAIRFGLTRESCPSHPSNCRAEWIEDALKKGHRYLALKRDGRLCGCVGIQTRDSGACTMERLAVLPEYRRQGLGTALVEGALEVARGTGAEEVGIGIIADHKELRRWYERLGFQFVQAKRFDHLPFEVAFLARRLP